jgi:GxxExxY protein
METIDSEDNRITSLVIGMAMRVHSRLGFGLLESAYEACLAYELTKAQLRYERQKPIPVLYDEVRIDVGYRLDLLVEGRVIVETKAVDSIAPIHVAQVLTYLRLSGCRVGLIINFNVLHLRHGIKRLVQDALDVSRAGGDMRKPRKNPEVCGGEEEWGFSGDPCEPQW